MSKISQHLAADVKKTASKEKSKSKAKMAHSFHVKQAHDGSGFVVETRKEGGNDYDPGVTSLHKTTSSIKKHMDDCCGGASDKSEPE